MVLVVSTYVGIFHRSTLTIFLCNYLRVYAMTVCFETTALQVKYSIEIVTMGWYVFVYI